MPLLSFEHVDFGYRQDKPVIRDVSFEIAQGEMAVFWGPSGCGKSTLLKLSNLLLDPSSGTIVWEGGDTSDAGFEVPSFRRQCALVMQKPHLIDDTVKANLLLIRDFKDVGELTDRYLISQMDQIGLHESYLERNVSDLSIGEAHRIAVLRTLLTKPKALLLDEPTASLDAVSARMIVQTVLKYREEFDMTVLWVTHQAEHLDGVDAPVFMMEGGGIVETITMKELRAKAEVQR